jgi:putative transposase
VSFSPAAEYDGVCAAPSDGRGEIARDVRSVLQASDRAMAEASRKGIIQKYSKTAPRLSSWMEINLPEGLTAMEFPESHRRLLRTGNIVERLDKEIRRRTRVVTMFPNVSSCHRPINAILMEVDEDWQMAKRCLTFPKTEEMTTESRITRRRRTFYSKILAFFD